MKRPTEPAIAQDPAVKAAAWARRLPPELVARWQIVRELAAPAMTAPALALALVLGASLGLAWLLQFFTGLYEAKPELSYVHAGLNVLLAGALAALTATRGQLERIQWATLAAAGAVVLLSLWSIGAKLQYQRGLAGNAFYTLPHQPFRYPPEAENVFIRTSDGVRIAGTLLNHHHRKGVVIFPSWRTNRDSFAIATLALWLSNSVDVLVLDPRGQGDSEGVKTPDGQEKYDILAAVAYLHASEHGAVGVLAEEDAAIPAILAAGMHQGIDSLALVAPSAHWGESLGQQGRAYDPNNLTGRLYWRVVAGLRLAGGPPTPPVTEVIRYTSPTPLLVTGCRTDAGSTIDQLHLGAGEPKSLIVLGGEGRPVTWDHFAEYFAAVEQWFALSLRGAPGS